MQEMDRDFIRLTGECLKNIYELTIKFPDNPVDCAKIETIVSKDEITASRIMGFLEGEKLIRLHTGGCVTITMKGMDKVIMESINRYFDELNNTIDPTYYSQYV